MADRPENACGHYQMIDNPDLGPKFEHVDTIVDGRRVRQLYEVDAGPVDLDESVPVAIPHWFTYDDCPRCNSEEV